MVSRLETFKSIILAAHSAHRVDACILDQPSRANILGDSLLNRPARRSFRKRGMCARHYKLL